MPYVVLARKYRPRSFAQMVGQEHVVQALSNALQTQRLHHAYLFTGTRGIGKTTVSRILAKSLNCTGVDGNGGITAEPCGVCNACTAIDADRYIDYTELDAASNRSIDEIRDLIERAAYKPGIGRFKVFMIDEAHQLTKDAFNALLKTLEEPPDYLKFVLATTDPDKMLPTVLSRCLQFNLRPMAPATVRAHLQHVLAAEGVAADDGSLRLLARAARGSMRDGLSLADQAIAYGGGALSEDVVRTMLGSVDRGHARALVEALARRDGAAVLAGVDGLRGLGLSAAGTLEEMALLLQQIAVEQAVPGALDAQDPDSEDARSLARAALLAPDETQLLYSMVLHGRAELALMSDEYGALTMVLLRFLAFPAAGPAALAAAAAPRAGQPAATKAGTGGVTNGVRDDAAAGASAMAGPAEPVERDTDELPVDGRVEARFEGRDDGRVDGRVEARAEARAAALRTPAPPAITLPVVPSVVARPLPTTPPAARTASGWQPPASPPPALSVAEPSAPPFGGRTSPAAATKSSAAAAAVATGPAAGSATDPAAATGPGAEVDSTATTIAVAAVAAVAAAASATATTALGDRWYALVKRLCARGALTALARELAMQAGLRAVDEAAEPPRWQLCVERETLRHPALRDKVAAALAAELGQPVAVEVDAGVPDDSPARRDAAERQRRQAAAEAAIHNDPLVRELLSQYKTARIVPGSIKPVQPKEATP